MNQRLTSILFAISSIMTLTILSCKKEEQYMNNAEITGFDNRLTPCLITDPCNCPGGVYIHIDNVPNPHGNCFGCNSFKAVKLPADFTLGNNLQFPIAVKIDWKFDSLICDSTRIDITRIARR